jgi:hypothetical protein
MCLTLAGCGSAPARESKNVDPGADVQLAPGKTVTVSGAELNVRFVAVGDDSRCPRDVTCMWAGEVKVRLDIGEGSKPIRSVEIAEGGNAEVGAWRVTVVRVEPQPVSTAKIAAGDYRVTLSMSNAQDRAR